MKKIIAVIAAAVLVMLLCACSDNPAALEYKGYSMSKAEYSYWFSTFKTQMVNDYNAGVDNDAFWDNKTPDGKGYDALFTDIINERIAGILVSVALFDEYGLELDDETVAAIDSDIAEKEDYAGGLSEMNSDLAKFGLNADVLREVYINAAKNSAVVDHLSTAGDDEIAAYYAENYRAVKLIVVYTDIMIETDENGKYTYDESGNVKTVKLSESEKEQKKELVGTVVEALESGADPDECIAEFSETDYSDFPRGLLISKNDAGSYGSDIVGALWDMEIGDVKTVEDDVMTFIMIRSELPDYSSLTPAELDMISGVGDYVNSEKVSGVLRPLIADVMVNEEIVSDFDIRTAHRNSYY